jgi:hypothetical protein
LQDARIDTRDEDIVVVALGMEGSRSIAADEATEENSDNPELDYQQWHSAFKSHVSPYPARPDVTDSVCVVALVTGVHVSWCPSVSQLAVASIKARFRHVEDTRDGRGPSIGAQREGDR